MFNNKIFSDRLSELMKKTNISALALSKVLGFSDTTILKWKKGKIIPTIDKLYALCQYFDVSADYLIGLED